MNCSLTDCDLENTPKFSLEGKYRCKILDVYDGDTVVAAIELGPKFIRCVRLRLHGIDAPEMKPSKLCLNRDMIKTKAIYARDQLKEKIIHQIMNVEILGNDKYGGRFLATLEMDDGCDISQWMIAEQLAKPYNGGKKEFIA